jgi:hypothetical protein
VRIAVVLAGAGTADTGLELGGLLATMLQRGRIVIVAYNVRPDEAQGRILSRLASIGVSYSIERGEQLHSTITAFDEYLLRYGISASAVRAEDDRVAAEVIARFPNDPAGPESAAAARFSIGSGQLYVLPYHVAQLPPAHDALVTAMLRAVREHQASGDHGVEVPPFLADLRLPGEADLLGDIDQMRETLHAAEEHAQALQSFRLMLGPASGERLEGLVIEAVNRILDGSDYRAEDRDDLGAEDFWIVGPAGDFALAEVKGINTSVKRVPVNQVDDHRSHLGHDDGEPPGLLVVNTHRGTEDLAAKSEEIHPDVREHAHRQNVVLLTGLDLYELVGLAMAGHDAAADLIAGLETGGGLLRVRDGATQLLR